MPRNLSISVFALLANGSALCNFVYFTDWYCDKAEISGLFYSHVSAVPAETLHWIHVFFNFPPYHHVPGRVGKWHAGMATPDHTPLGRGYDTSLIYFDAANDYWTSQV